MSSTADAGQKVKSPRNTEVAHSKPWVFSRRETGGKPHKEECGVCMGGGMCQHQGRISLVVATRLGRESEVRRLLKLGVETDSKDSFGYTSLLIAAECGVQTVVEVLLAAGANVHWANDNGQTALIRAAEKGNTEIVQILLDAGANMNVADSRGNSSLYLAAAEGHENVVRVLLSKGAIIDAKTSKSPLLAAVRKDNCEIARHLLDRVTAVKGKGNYLEAIYQISQENEEPDVFILLLSFYVLKMHRY
jgi:hypothetical protein